MTCREWLMQKRSNRHGGDGYDVQETGDRASSGSAILTILALVLGVLALMLRLRRHGASAANGSCVGTHCQWNCNPQAGSSWCWFDSGGVNARNWFYNDATDFYATHVFKCAAAIRADNGNTWSSSVAPIRPSPTPTNQ